MVDMNNYITLYVETCDSLDGNWTIIKKNVSVSSRSLSLGRTAFFSLHHTPLSDHWFVRLLREWQYGRGTKYLDTLLASYNGVIYRSMWPEDFPKLPLVVMRQEWHNTVARNRILR